jgi:hypothetical protein
MRTHNYFARNQRLLNVSALALLVLLALATRAGADELHGPAAPPRKFLSHHFRLAAHQPPGVQLAFHYGLVQPILYGGFNAAVDVRWRRLIFTYSHGAALNFTSSLVASERAAGLRAYVPFTTGGGVGVLLIDELYVLVDFKYHRFDLSLGAEHPSYDTFTIGGEIGWRLFLWKGLYLSPVLRYWPEVWTSAPARGVALNNGAILHQPLQQGYNGFFANVLIGWAFNL